MARARWWMLVVAGMALAVVAGCEGAYVTRGGQVKPVDSTSLPSVMGKLNDLNGDVGSNLAGREWEQLAEESQKMANWAGTASRLKSQSTNPEAFAKHCDQLSTAARAVNKAAMDRDAKAASDNHATVGKLLGEMGQLLK